MLDTIISSLSKLTYISYVSPTAHWEGTAMCYRWENGGTERLHNLPKVTQLAAGRAEFLGQVLWLWTTLTGYWLELYQLTVVMMLVALCRPELVICYVLHEWKKKWDQGMVNKCPKFDWQDLSVHGLHGGVEKCMITGSLIVKIMGKWGWELFMVPSCCPCVMFPYQRGVDWNDSGVNLRAQEILV